MPEMQQRIDEGVEKAGRDPKKIHRAYNISGRIGQEGDGPLDGPVSKWTEGLRRFALEIGMDTFIFWPSEDRKRQVELFANEVVPAVREALAAERSR
jgi:hypothetical protein